MKDITFTLTDGTPLAHTTDDETPNLNEVVSLETITGTDKKYVSYLVTKVTRNYVHNSLYVDPIYVQAGLVTVEVSPLP